MDVVIDANTQREVGAYRQAVANKNDNRITQRQFMSLLTDLDFKTLYFLIQASVDPQAKQDLQNALLNKLSNIPVQELNDTKAQPQKKPKST